MYTPGCGMMNVNYAFGHDEYGYLMALHNKLKIPEEGLAILRLHSCYPWHTGKAYRELMKPGDEKLEASVIEFNQCVFFPPLDSLPLSLMRRLSKITNQPSLTPFSFFFPGMTSTQRPPVSLTLTLCGPITRRLLTGCAPGSWTGKKKNRSRLSSTQAYCPPTVLFYTIAFVIKQI